ncbi:MAG TPA: AraC family transcriptional regulator [Bryobacteraceae bacterium]|jgi:AraC-like DNA-binding protein
MLRELKWESALRVIEPQITNQGRHVWPFNPSFPVDVRFFLLNRQHDIPLVRPDHLEVIYIESGEVVYESRNGQCLLRKGDIVVVGDSVSHRCRKSVGSSLKRAAVLLFLPELILDGVSGAERLKYLMPFKMGECAFPNVLAGSTATSVEVFELIQRISSELPHTSERSRLVIKSYLKMILALVANHFLNAQAISPPILDGTSVLRLEAVLKLVENRYPTALTVEEAADIAGLSRWQFMHLFKRVMGQSFISYLHHFRIGKAQDLLASTGMSLVDVSFETGFCDQSYFGLIFRRYAHMTPLGYRRRFFESRQSAASN